VNADLEAWSITSRAAMVALGLAVFATGVHLRQSRLPATHDSAARNLPAAGRAAAVLLVAAAVLAFGPILITVVGAQDSSSSLGFLLELGGSG
jgi:hypothetical protein